MKTTFLLPLLAASVIFSSGCATKVNFTSDPPGAFIRYRGEGRAAFRWKTEPVRTPTMVKMYYGRISAYAIWPDGKTDPDTKLLIPVKTEPQEVSLSALRDSEAVHFVMPE